MTKIGIIREDKVPVDRRVALSPEQAREVKEKFKGVEVVCQSSKIRCFNDEEYIKQGISIVESVEDCDILLGVKEVPKENLIEGKTYLFFSHTVKEQVYNRELLKTILKKKIRMVDYELLTDHKNARIIAFGRYAGLVGAYNAIWTYGKRYNLYHLRRAHECFDFHDMKKELKKVELPHVRFILTGGGRVAKGAMEVLMAAGIRRVSPEEFLTEHFDFPIFTQLNARDYHERKDGGPFSLTDFFQNPEHYEGDFVKYAKKGDVLIAGAFWDPRSPRLFGMDDAVKNSFRIKVIADITCDIKGSIPSTIRPCTIDQPLYDFNPTDEREEAPLTDEGNITVMAIDNLPCELPRDASWDFGQDMLNKVIPHLIGTDTEGIIERATIAKEGALTKKYAYLQNFVDGK
ncbi:MAG: NAD(P)-dependent oxidoreductase [Cyclobacteriaceae bacterium]|nr:NAD(P)-dependent oxidoreductase [Cyclobacteriaceae bacterium]